MLQEVTTPILTNVKKVIQRPHFIKSQLPFPVPANLAERKKIFLNKYRWEIGLIEVCDICGKPLLKGQKLGKRKSNDALCHDKCLYYKIGKLFVTREELGKKILKDSKKYSVK